MHGLSGNSSGTGANRTSVINSADLKITCSISYADVKMCSWAELNSPAEYRTWLLSKVKYMAQHGNVFCTGRYRKSFLIKPFHIHFRNGRTASKFV